MNPSLAFRQWLHGFATRPGFHLLVLGILTLGIGVNAAMLTLAERALFRPLGVSEPERVVRAFTSDEAGENFSNGSYTWFAGLSDQVDVFSRAAAYSDWITLNVALDGDSPQRVSGGVASGEFFQVLGVSAARGRLIGVDDDRVVGAHPVVVVSDRFWRTRLGTDAHVVGRTLRINREPYTLIGVLPPGFEGPDLASRVDLWLPLAMAPKALPGLIPENFRESTAFSWLDVIARLADGVEMTTAQAALDVWASAIEAERAGETVRDGRPAFALLKPLDTAAVDVFGTRGHVRNAWLLLGVAALVLVVACANAAALLAVRSDERGRELAVRASLGASPGRLLRQLFAELTMLGLLALGLGLLLARLVVALVVDLAPPGVLLPVEGGSVLLSGRVFALVVLCALLAMALAAWLPARRTLALDPVEGLRLGSRTASMGAGRQRWRSALVVTQLAMTLVLLVGAGLMLRTLWNESSIDPGFRAAGLVTGRLDVARPGAEAAELHTQMQRFEEALAVLPGVSEVRWMRTVPPQPTGMRTTAESDHPDTPRGNLAQADFNIVSPGTFATLGVAMLRGRDFVDSDDGTRPVAIVNRAYAERFFPGMDALGRRIVSLSRDTGGVEIVGVVENFVQRDLRGGVTPQVFVPPRQFRPGQSAFLIRTSGDAAALMAAIPRAIATVDPEQPVFGLRSLADQIEASYRNASLFAWLLGGFAVLGIALAGSGLFGLMSFWLRGRERDLGIRMALGASREHLARLVLRIGGGLWLGGVLVGLLLALLAGNAMQALLYGVDARDPGVLAIAAATLAMVACLAVLGPLRRLRRVQPMTVLREE